MTPDLTETIAELKPEDGEYSLVEVSTGEPVASAGHVIAEFNDAGEVAIPPDTDFETYVVYDRAGNTYTRESWPEPFAEASDDGAAEKARHSDLPDFMSSGGRNF